MSFLQDDIKIDITSVVNIYQKERDEVILGAPYNALSFRYFGNTNLILNGETFSTKKNNILFLPKNAKYKHVTKEPEHLIVIHFEANIPIDSKIEVFNCENNAIIKGLFESAYELWSEKKTGYTFETTACLYKIFAQLQKTLNSTATASSGKIKFAIEYIHEHYTEPDLSIAKISQLLGMSETYFRKLFYKNLQKTPHDYINRLRLCYAEELLRSGYYNVSEAANMSGFLDPNYFSTAMKKATGIPPSKMINKL